MKSAARAGRETEPATSVTRTRPRIDERCNLTSPLKWDPDGDKLIATSAPRRGFGLPRHHIDDYHCDGRWRRLGLPRFGGARAPVRAMPDSPPTAPACRPVPSSGTNSGMAKELNIGLIGYGFMGRTHSNAYRKVSNFFDVKLQPRLKVVCGRDENNAKAFAAKWGYESVETDWRKVIERKDVDAVDICTPNNSHKEIAI